MDISGTIPEVTHVWGKEELRKPSHLAVHHATRRLAVCDKDRVALFHTDGTFLLEIAARYFASEPLSVAFADDGQLYVVDSDALYLFAVI